MENVFIVAMIISILLQKNDNWHIIIIGTTLIILFLASLFNMAWVIVGSVMFWRDCLKIVPVEINDLMWATLLINIIMCFICNFSLGLYGGMKKK